MPRRVTGRMCVVSGREATLLAEGVRLATDGSDLDNGLLVIVLAMSITMLSVAA